VGRPLPDQLIGRGLCGLGGERLPWSAACGGRGGRERTLPHGPDFCDPPVFPCAMIGDGGLSMRRRWPFSPKLTALFPIGSSRRAPFGAREHSARPLSSWLLLWAARLHPTCRLMGHRPVATAPPTEAARPEKAPRARAPRGRAPRRERRTGTRRPPRRARGRARQVFPTRRSQARTGDARRERISARARAST
jgi:hypothetical protein